MIATAQAKPHNFDSITVFFATPEEISFSPFDVVKKPKTIKYPSFKPERSQQCTANIINPSDVNVVCSYIKAKRLK